MCLTSRARGNQCSQGELFESTWPPLLKSLNEINLAVFSPREEFGGSDRVPVSPHCFYRWNGRTPIDHSGLCTHRRLLPSKSDGIGFTISLVFISSFSNRKLVLQRMKCRHLVRDRSSVKACAASWSDAIDNVESPSLNVPRHDAGNPGLQRVWYLQLEYVNHLFVRTLNKEILSLDNSFFESRSIWRWGIAINHVKI